ncbi:MAG TPA: hypothetical protein VHO46_15150 [Bacteroidales bacterium]|nr:hypothetical protein [Bacteroidales bacterium]
MKKPCVLLLFIILLQNISAQTPVGTWTDHLVYSVATSVAVGSEDIFASTGSSILIYNKTLAELQKLSHVNGLSETDISSIAWSEAYNTLVIGYSSANIDLVVKNVIFNLPDIERKYISGEKNIYKIRTNGKYAYIACSFGIVVADLLKKEIFDTWKPSLSGEDEEVYDIAFGEDKVYAATKRGVYSAELKNTGLSYYDNWDLIPSIPDQTGKYTSLIFTGKSLVAVLSSSLAGGDAVHIIDETGSKLLYFEPGVYNITLDKADDGFTLTNRKEIRLYDAAGALKISINGSEWGSPDIVQAVADGNDLWIADLNNGLVHGNNLTDFNILTLPGPVTNSVFNISSLNGKTIITGGGVTNSWNNVWKPFQVSVNEGNIWSSLTPSGIHDPMRSLIDPSDNNHFFITTWGGGLLEYKGEDFIKYDDSNSPLQTIIAGSPYVRVCGLAMDKNKNLWITQTEVPSSLKVLKPDGTWLSDFKRVDAPDIGDIVIADNGYKWVTLPRGHGLYVLDDNSTPGNTSDDRDIHMYVIDSDNRMITNIYSIAADLEGVIWVGTDQGPFLYYNTEKIFESTVYAYRVKIPRNDGTDLADYMLSSETITAIAVDEGNRKWIGTRSSGVYLLSPDGTSQLAHFEETNSPLLSNSINSIAVDNKTGEVWIGTSKGIVSYRGNAGNTSDSFEKVYAFPNPVREDFSGNVTITGLMRDTDVKITDVSGNLVFETKSNGGMATWYLTNLRGKRVATGVYIAFCSSADGMNSAVTKILVIR